MKKSTQSNQTSGSPAPIVSSADALATAEAHLNELTRRFVEDGSLTHPQRAGLVQDIKAAKARLNELKQAEQ